jgi:7-cyano-7-deazaguanine synthase
MMEANELLAALPIKSHQEGLGAVVVLSGGMDSAIAARLCVEKYGADYVRALTFDYGQKQSIEIERAKEITNILGIKHKVCDLSVLGDISKGFSANVDVDIKMPDIRDVIGDPRPKTYVPNRNMILMSIAAAYAEVEHISTIVMGLQIHDEYGYHDTTQKFVDKVNNVLSENRIIKIQVIAPFSQLSKHQEITLLKELDGNVDLLSHTMTCYNPSAEGISCGKCPSCSERIMNFGQAGMEDPLPYQIEIPWNKLIH